MLNQPSQEQINKLWAWCGFKPIERSIYFWEDPYGDKFTHSANLDFNNLFKYAIPKLQDKGYQIDICCYEQSGFMVEIVDVIHDENLTHAITNNDDLSLALFWAVWEIVK